MFSKVSKGEGGGVLSRLTFYSIGTPSIIVHFLQIFNKMAICNRMLAIKYLNVAGNCRQIESGLLERTPTCCDRIENIILLIIC